MYLEYSEDVRTSPLKDVLYEYKKKKYINKELDKKIRTLAIPFGVSPSSAFVLAREAEEELRNRAINLIRDIYTNEGDTITFRALRDILTDDIYINDKKKEASDIITTILISTSSSFVLSILLFKVEPVAIFGFISDNIVNPIINPTLLGIEPETKEADRLKVEIENREKFKTEIGNYVYSFIIKRDKDEMREIKNRISTLIGLIPSDLVVSVRDSLNSLEIAVPLFLYKILGDLCNKNGEVAPKLSQVDANAYGKDLASFFEEINTIYTEEGAYKLFSKYYPTREVCGDNIALYEDKIKQTILKRNSYVGVVDKKKVDGFTVNELLCINRILNGETLTKEDDSLVTNNKLLSNIKLIIKSYASTDRDVIKITSDLITIENFYSKEVASFNWRSDEISTMLNNPFYIFGSNRKKIENLNNIAPLTCPYNLSGFTSDDLIGELTNGRRRPILTSEIDVSSHRRQQIAKLKQKHNNDIQLLEKVKIIENTDLTRLQYVQSNRKSHYENRNNNDKLLLLQLVETEKLYHHIKAGLNKMVVKGAE